MALGTVETFAAYRGVEFDPTDIQATLAVDQAYEFVRTYCHQVFDLMMDDTITMDGSGTRALVLPQLPVLDVTEVTVTDQNGTETELIVAVDWTLDADNGVLQRKNHWDDWPLGKANISITYDHGYEVLPADLMGVILSLASRHMQSSTGGEVTRERIGTYEVDYDRAAMLGGLEEGERGVLDRRYRQLRLA